MNRRDKITLQKILKYCKEINDAMEMFHSDFEVFRNSSVFQNSCCMCVLQIGELAKVLTKEYTDSNQDIPWKAWCGIRDVFAHQYGNLDKESAWRTLNNDIPKLEKHCKDKLIQGKESE